MGKLLVFLIVIFAHSPIVLKAQIAETRLSGSSPNAVPGYGLFGWSADISGAYAIVGDQNNSEKGDIAGAAYIFQQIGSSWIEVAKLTASDGEAGQQFGFDVAISDDYAVVGAWRDSDKGGDAGAVYFFQRHDETWIEMCKITASDGEPRGQFGRSVAISGEYAIVTAVHYSRSSLDRVYFFQRRDTTWIEIAKFSQPGIADWNRAADISGDYAIVGGSNPESSVLPEIGWPHIYHLQDSVWTLESVIKVDDVVRYDKFGESVSISGGYALVSAPGFDSEVVYLFTKSDDGWRQDSMLIGPSSGIEFGLSVSINGDYAIIGAPADHGNERGSGAAYVYARRDSSWLLISELFSSNGDDGDRFGVHVTIDGDNAIVGAPFERVEGEFPGYGGAAYVYSGLLAVKLKIDSVVPSRGGNTGIVSILLQGTLFEEGATVSLEGNSGGIIGQTGKVFDNGTAVAATFDLNGQSLGLKDVILTNPDGNSTTLAAGFLIEEGREAQIWVDILGREVFRGGSEVSYQVLFGNSGNVNWEGLAGLTVYVPQGMGPAMITYNTPLIPADLSVGELIPGPAQPVALPHSEVFVPLIIPLIPPGIPHSYTFTFQPNQQIDGEIEVVQFEVDQPSMAELIYYLNMTKAWELGIALPNHDTSFSEAFQQALQEVLSNIIKEVTIEIGVDILLPIERVCNDIGSGEERLECTSVSEWIKEAVKEALDKVETSHTVAVQSYRAMWTALLEPENWSYYESAIMANFDVLSTDINSLPFQLTEPLPIGIYPPVVQPTRSATSVDPNDKIGPRGAGKEGYIGVHEPLQYTIYFENLKNATAHAAEITISDRLDLARIDTESLTMGTVQFGNIKYIPPAGKKDINVDIDLRPEKEIIARITSKVDHDTGLVIWNIKAIDPYTGQLIEDPFTGLLPPNVTPPEGEGLLKFVVFPRKTSNTGFKILNNATIVFDNNQGIETPTWSNTLDVDPPSSEVLSVNTIEGSDKLMLRWQGHDIGSGIQDYSIYISEDNKPYTTWVSHTTDTTRVFVPDKHKRYQFYSIAHDIAGNREITPPNYDVVVTGIDEENAGGTVLKTTLSAVYPNPLSTQTTILYDVSRSTGVKIVIYDILGRNVGVLVDENKASGSYKVEWKPKGLSNGVYIIRLESGEYNISRKAILMN
jgi:hypothetical protein